MSQGNGGGGPGGGDARRHAGRTCPFCFYAEKAIEEIRELKSASRMLADSAEAVHDYVSGVAKEIPPNTRDNLAAALIALAAASAGHVSSLTSMGIVALGIIDGRVVVRDKGWPDEGVSHEKN